MKRLVWLAALSMAALTFSGCPKPPPEEPKPDPSKIRKAVLDSLKKAVAEEMQPEMQPDDPPPSQGPSRMNSGNAIGFILPLIRRMASEAAKRPRDVVERKTNSPPTTDRP